MISNDIKASLKLLMMPTFLDFNDGFTRAELRRSLISYLSGLKKDGVIKSFEVKCDTENNPPLVIHNNQIVAEVQLDNSRAKMTLGSEGVIFEGDFDDVEKTTTGNLDIPA